MRAVVQRVSRARVTVEGRVAGEIGAGLMILLGVGREDSATVAASVKFCKGTNSNIFAEVDVSCNGGYNQSQLA